MKDNKKKHINIKTSSRKKSNIKPLERFAPVKAEEGENWRDKLFKHRAKVFTRIIVFVVVLVLATAFFYIRFLNKQYSSYEVLNSVENSVASGAKVEKIEDKFLIYGNDGAKCVNSKGELIWNVTYEMQNPKIDIDNHVVGIADYNGSTIHMMDTEGVLGEINTGMPIKLFRVSAKELAIAVLDDSRKTPIYVYGTDGEQKAFFNTTMRNSGYPISLCISDSGYLVGISYLYEDASSYKTNIAFYNFGDVGQNKTDNLVSGNTYANAIVPCIQFVGNSKAVAVADNRLMIYSGDQIPTSTGEVLVQDEIQAVYFGEEYVALVHNNTEGDERYRIDVYDGTGELEDTVLYNEDYTDMFFHNGRLIIYGPEYLLVHNVNGIDKYKGEFVSGALAVMPTNVSNRFVVVTDDAIETIELQ